MIKPNNNLMLALTAMALAIACIVSVYSPISFDKQREKRETEVKERLIIIRQAQEKFRKMNGRYAPSLKTLVNMGFLADSLRFIPHAEGRQFTLKTGTLTTTSGKDIPVMECGAEYRHYLSGLDKDEISSLTEAADNAGQYAGLKIGDINIPDNNAGNWE